MQDKSKAPVFLFDIDNTLTPPRSRIMEKHYLTFMNFVFSNKVYLLTGSDYDKAIEQMGRFFLDSVDGVFTCTGNVFHKQGVQCYEKQFLYDKSLIEDLNYLLRTTKYPYHIFDTHIEYRRGMLNFSTVGRGADKENRAKYFNWDKENGERMLIVKYLQQKHPNLDFCIGGEISIDIFQKGQGKDQAVHYLNKSGFENIVFFGDKIYEYGNDKAAADAIERLGIGKSYQVSGPDETFKILIREYGE